MLYRNLGPAGLQVSAISLGSWTTFGQSVDQDNTEACMAKAYELGVNFFDGAEAYGQGAAEIAMGKAFAKFNWPRDTYIVSTKVIRVGDAPTQRGLSRKHLVEACDAALKRMGLDYVDLIFCHRPDPKTSLEEIVHTMNQLIQRGKAFYWGTSEFSALDLEAMHAIARRDHLVGPTMEQTNHSMLHRQRVDGELVALFDRHNLGTTIYSPLAQGVLTGKYNDAVPGDSRFADMDPQRKQHVLSDDRLDKVRKLTDIAGELGISMAQLALAWCLHNPNVSTAIIGATRPQQVQDNVAACEAVDKLTDDVMDRIETILDNRPA